MNQTKALQSLLEDQTNLYAKDRVPVRFSQQPHYAGPSHGGPYIAVNPDIRGWYDVEVSGANELRLLRDTLSHECYEYVLGHPSAKKAFMQRHGSLDPVPSPKARAAGNVYNILRDAWVNTQRCRDFPGLRRTFAYKADLLAGEADVSDLGPASAVLAGLHQISLTNTANGIRDADPEVRSALATVRRYIELCRTAGSHDELVAVADAVFRKFETLFEDPESEFEDLLDRLEQLSPDTETEDMSDEDLADAIDNAVQDPDTEVELVEDPEDADPDAPSVDADDLDDETVEALEDLADEADTGSGGGDGEETDTDPDTDADPEDAAGGDGTESDDEGDESGDGSGGDGDESDETPQGDETAEDRPSDAGGDDVGTESDPEADAAGDDVGPQDGTGGDPDADGDGDAGEGSDDVPDDDGVLADMDRLDGDDRAAGDMVGLDDEDDYHEPDSGDEARFERVQRAQAFASTDWSDRMDRRDDYSHHSTNDLPSEAIRDLMRETGLAKDLRRAFERIKTSEVTETTTSPTSTLHLGNVVRHMAGDYGVRDVYESTKRGASGGRTIAAVMDASGSMDAGGSIGEPYGAEGCIVDAKVVLAALHLAAHEIGDRVVATAYDTDASDHTRLITGPDETFEWGHLDAFTGHSGSTATAAGVMDGIGLLERAGGKDRVMVVITDGGANASLASTKWAEYSVGGSVKDARAAVELAREEGIKVIGVGVGKGVSSGKLENTFGTDGWIHVESDDLVEEVVRIYVEQLDHDTDLSY